MTSMLHGAIVGVLSLPVLLLSRPAPVAAHVKWFVEEKAINPVEAIHYSLAEPVVLAWVGIILGSLVTAALLDRYLPGPPEPLMTFAHTHRPNIVRLFQVMVGVALLLTAAKGAIIAPHLAEQGQLGLLLRFAEGGIGVLLIANFAVGLAGALMVAVYLVSAGLFGFISSLEYFNFLGIALFLLLNSAPAASRFREYALPLLRVHTGIALAVLAWTEKLYRPDLAMQFLRENQVNFMQTLGFEFFSDRLFVLCAGCTELIFGLIFILGLITRINTLALAGFLISSNAYFFLVGKTEEAFLEMSGHLPIVAIAVLFIMYGSGRHLRLRLRRDAPSQED